MNTYRYLVLAGLLLALIETPALAGQSGVSAKVKTVTVQQDTLSETIESFGRVTPDPDAQSNIAAVRDGTIAQLMVRPGQQVSAGQALFRLATAPASRMNYQQAKANVRFARAKLARKRSLLKQHMATQSDVAAAEKSLRHARENVKAQKHLGADQSSSLMRAPYNGVISDVKVSEGDRVQQGTTVVQISRRDGMLILLGVEQEVVGRLQKGQVVVLEPVFKPDLKIQSAISEVHAMADPVTGLVDVVVKIPSDRTADLIFNEMMRGRTTLKQYKTLAVPQSAVLNDRKGHYLFRVDRKGIAHKVYVKNGIQSQDKVAVSGPIKAGDTVVTLGNYQLTDGMRVRETRQ